MFYLAEGGESENVDLFGNPQVIPSFTAAKLLFVCDIVLMIANHKEIWPKTRFFASFSKITFVR